MAILHTLLEMEGYTPNLFEQSTKLAEVIKKVHFGKVSVEKAVTLICNLIKKKEIRYANTNQ